MSLLSQPCSLTPPAHQCRGQEGGIYTDIWITIPTIHPPAHCRKQPAAQQSHMHSLVLRYTDVWPGNYTDISITESQGHMALVSTLSACEQLHIPAKVLKCYFIDKSAVLHWYGMTQTHSTCLSLHPEKCDCSCVHAVLRRCGTVLCYICFGCNGQTETSGVCVCVCL